MTLSFQAPFFVAHCTYAERSIAQKARMRFSKKRKAFYTRSLVVASRLREYADETAEKEINKVLLQYKPWSGRITWPKGKKALWFQPGAAQFFLERSKSYLFADPGVGKTVIAALLMRVLSRNVAVIYLCPPFLMSNVSAKLTEWRAVRRGAILSDSIVHKESQQKYLRDLPGPKILIIDEAHRFKNPSARRTKALNRKIVPMFDQVIRMSGSASPNGRMMELYDTLITDCPELIDFKTREDFGKRYCGAKWNGFGWEYNGATHVKELSDKLEGKYMLRLRKDLLELPPKSKEIVIIGETPGLEVERMEAEILKKYSAKDLMKGKLGKADEDLHISTYLRLLGVTKVNPATPLIVDALEQGDKVIVAARHKEVVASLRVKLRKFQPYVIDGSVSPKLRDPLAKEFDRGKTRRLMILNAQSGGVGLDIPDVDRVIHLEPSFSPEINKQVEDRADRQGRVKTSLLCQYIVFKNSIDRKIMEANFRKEGIINQI